MSLSLSSWNDIVKLVPCCSCRRPFPFPLLFFFLLSPFSFSFLLCVTDFFFFQSIMSHLIRSRRRWSLDWRWLVFGPVPLISRKRRIPTPPPASLRSSQRAEGYDMFSVGGVMNLNDGLGFSQLLLWCSCFACVCLCMYAISLSYIVRSSFFF